MQFILKRISTEERRTGFTLIELLIVVGITVILATAAILILNPAELFKQARDSQRVNDIGTLNKALSLYATDVLNGSMGQLQTVYVSLPDAAATTTAGTDCAALGLPQLPPGWGYHCASPAALRNIDGTGWIPVNFANTSFSSALATLPIDPVNDAASGLYYTYQKGSWELTAVMESVRYSQGGAGDVSSKDSGKYADVMETGTNLAILPLDRALIAKSTSTPTVALTAPSAGTTVSTTVVTAATASDPIGIANVQFFLDGSPIGNPVTLTPYQMNWDTTLASNGVHNLTAYAVNLGGRGSASLPVSITINNVSSTLPALVQFTVTSNAPAGSCSAQLNSGVTPGNLLVFSVDTNSSTAALAVTDNQSNTWVNVNHNVSAAGTQDIFYVANAAGGITNVTANITNWSDALRSCELVEYSGAAALDKQSSLNGTGTNLRSGTSTTNFTNELIVGAGSVPNCGTCTPTPSPGFIIVVGSSKSFQEYRVVNPTGPYSAAVNVPISTPWLMNMATFH